jgi:hypothetical protein
LIASGDAAVDFLSNHINEKNDLSDQDIRNLITEYLKREGARGQLMLQTLVMQGGAAEAAIDDALGDQNLEQEQKSALQSCKELVQRYPESATELRMARTKQLLQVIHSEAAMKLLQQVPQGN